MSPGLLLRIALLGLLTLLIGVPAIVLALLLPGRPLKGKLFLVVSKTYARVTFLIFRIRVEGRGVERVDPGRPYVFMCNHESHVDAPAAAIVIPHVLHWVFKKELAKIPVFGWVLSTCGQIMVDRRDPEQSRTALAAAAASLSGSHSVMIFPEGTRSRDGSLQPFRKGGFWMALQSGLPIVPVRVSGGRAIVPAGTIRVRPGTVRVELFPPVPTAGLGPEDIPALVERVRAALLPGGSDPAAR